MSLPFPKLKFLDSGSQAAAEELDSFEKRWGAQLPAALKAWLAMHSDAMLDRDNYFLPMESMDGLPCSVGVEYVMSLGEMGETLDILEPAFPPKFVPFAHDGDGNYLLMSPDGGIHFWDYHYRIDPAHPAAVDECTLKIADSLPAFLSMLGPGPLTDEE